MVRLHERSTHPRINLGPAEKADDHFNNRLDSFPNLIKFFLVHMSCFWFMSFQRAAGCVGCASVTRAREWRARACCFASIRTDLLTQFGLC